MRHADHLGSQFAGKIEAMNTRRLVISITFLSIFAMAVRIVIDPDTFWHLATARYILNTHTIPHTDIFSFTRFGHPWRGGDVGWLIQIPFYWLQTHVGPGGIYLLTAVLVTIAYIFIYRSLSGGIFLRSFILILSAVTAAVHWSPRPYLATYVLSAVTLWLFESCTYKKRDHLNWLPLIMIIWVNSHTAHITAFLLWGVYTADAGLRWLADSRQGELSSGFQLLKNSLLGRYLKIGALMALAVGINPGGYRSFLYPFETMSIKALRQFVVEWQSPNFNDPMVFPFLILLLLVISTLAISKQRIKTTDFLLLAGFTYLSLTAQRNIAMFALISPIILTRHLAPITEAAGQRIGYRGLSSAPPTKFQNWINSLLLVIIILVVGLKILLVFSEETYQEGLRARQPVDAVEVIKKLDPPGKLFNSYNFGGYLLWALPEYPVFIDGRTDLFGDEIIGEWGEIISAKPGWENQLEDYGIGVILIEPHWELNLLLPGHGWQVIYQDDLAVVFIPE